jgi:rare lipoprotein A
MGTFRRSTTPLKTRRRTVRGRWHALISVAATVAVAGASAEIVRSLLGTTQMAVSSPYAAVSPHYKVGPSYRMNGVWYHPVEDPDYRRIGVASYYGGEARGVDFHGRPTANGEIYDMHALTAAHPTLPLPSLVSVTNLENGRSVVLRVNDRGPFVHGRLIDVSRRAAQDLGFERKGTASVRVEVLAAESRALKQAMVRKEPIAVSASLGTETAGLRLPR